jgi:tripartite-type tricarboxylate transporter receptor subunit TctC
MIVPFPAGGVTDVVARLTAERLTADLGQQVIVDNKAGAGGMIGTEVVAKAAPDGYTILFTTPNHTINAALRASMPFDTDPRRADRDGERAGLRGLSLDGSGGARPARRRR